MTTRKIKVLSTVGTNGVIETNVTTLGELKPLLRRMDIDYSGMRMMVGETRNELSLDEAVLPEGDFKFYLMPSKTKSGASASDFLTRIASEMATLADLFEGLGNVLSDKKDSQSPRENKTDPDMADLNRLAGGSGFTSRDIDYEEEEDDMDWG